MKQKRGAEQDTLYPTLSKPNQANSSQFKPIQANSSQFKPTQLSEKNKTIVKVLSGTQKFKSKFENELKLKFSVLVSTFLKFYICVKRGSMRELTRTFELNRVSKTRYKINLFEPD